MQESMKFEFAMHCNAQRRMLQCRRWDDAQAAQVDNLLGACKMGGIQVTVKFRWL
jgi:hypothetical protein